MKIKKKYIINKKIILYSIILTVVISVLLLIPINNLGKPIIIDIIKVEMSNLESNIVNNAINKIITKDYDLNELYTTTKSSDGKIQAIDFNAQKVNQVLSLVTIQIQNDLKKLENDSYDIFEESRKDKENIKNKNSSSINGIIMNISSNIIFKNIFLSTLGPNIPIKISYLGDINSKIQTKIKEYGINNALVEININVEVAIKVALPITIEKIRLTTSIPIAIKIIQGSIPNYYGNSIEKDSLLYSMPIK